MDLSDSETLLSKEADTPREISRRTVLGGAAALEVGAAIGRLTALSGNGVEGPESSNLLTGLQPDQLFSRATEAGTNSYLIDRFGSTIALAGESGEVEVEYTYDPFGTASSTGAGSDNPFQFTGRENDGTGLQYNRARYYSLTYGSFISQDPAGLEGNGSNFYWYANGDPVDFTDPSGKSPGLEFVPDPVAIVEGAVEDAANQVGDWVSGAPGVASETLDCRTTGILLDVEGVGATSTGVVVASTAPPLTAPAGRALILGGGFDDLLGVGFDVLGHEGIC